VEAVRSSLFDPLTREQVVVLGEISKAIREKLEPKCEAARAEADEAAQSG
jgi:hypothetical protein